MDDSQRWKELWRPLPEWFRKAKLGFFIHWGPYSVPAWGEPLGELGTIPPREWFKHNPYAEWYYNTIRIPGSPAAEHHQKVYGGKDYDDFLDDWKAENFDPVGLVRELAGAGGSYLVLTTKHHDGVCLWDAPGTAGRNTVARGPKRDLVGAYADACREVGIRFGAYYSGGLDWHVRPFPPIGLHETWKIIERPSDAEYAAYAAEHIRDLIRRYQPDVLWNDIDWPDEGKNFEPNGIGTVFEEYYAVKPDGVVNDRWNVPHADYFTSEYQHLRDAEESGEWEHCRGMGLSFGYNAVEGREHALAGGDAIKHLVDVVTRGGRLLLGVGPMADGQLPEWQSKILTEIGDWMRPAGHLLTDLKPSTRALDLPNVWWRIGQGDEGDAAFIDADHPVEVPAARLLTPEWGELNGDVLTCAQHRAGPVAVLLQ